MKARKSANRKYVVCGECGRSLCRRDRVERYGGPARVIDNHFVPGTEVVHVLAWEDGWQLVGDHIEMPPGAHERLEAGNRPSRRDWSNEERLKLSRALAQFVPALCRWGCGTLNEIDPKRLDVSGVAAITA